MLSRNFCQKNGSEILHNSNQTIFFNSLTFLFVKLLCTIWILSSPKPMKIWNIEFLHDNYALQLCKLMPQIISKFLEVFKVCCMNAKLNILHVKLLIWLLHVKLLIWRNSFLLGNGPPSLCCEVHGPYFTLVIFFVREMVPWRTTILTAMNSNSNICWYTYLEMVIAVFKLFLINKILYKLIVKHKLKDQNECETI